MGEGGVRPRPGPSRWTILHMIAKNKQTNKQNNCFYFLYKSNQFIKINSLESAMSPIMPKYSTLYTLPPPPILLSFLLLLHTLK